MSERLSDIREEIDTIDAELVRLLNRRLVLGLSASAAKLAEHAPVLDFTREDEVIAHVCELNEGPMSDDSLITLYLELLRQSRAVQRDVRTNPDKGLGKTPATGEWYIPTVDLR